MAINHGDHLFANICIYSKFHGREILFGRIPGVIIMYVTSILEKWLKSSGKTPLCHACTNLRTCRRYTLATVNISEIFSNGNALSVFLPERVAKNINLIT